MSKNIIKQELDTVFGFIKIKSVFLFYISYILLALTVATAAVAFIIFKGIFIGIVIPMLTAYAVIRAQKKAKKDNAYDCYGIVSLCISLYMLIITLQFL